MMLRENHTKTAMGRLLGRRRKGHRAQADLRGRGSLPRRGRSVVLVGALLALAAVAVPFGPTPSAFAAGDNTVTVTKVVNGTPTESGLFEVAVRCGASLQTLTFGPTGGTQSATFADTLTSCTVQETEPRGADTSSIQAVSATAAIVIPDGADATNPVQITFDAGGGQSVNVGVTNTFTPPASANTVQVTKVVEGDAPPGAFFQVDVVCGPTVVQVLFTASGGTKAALIPATDTNCTVNEVVTSANQPLQVTYDPPGAPVGLPPFLPGGSQTRAVTVTNRYASPNPLNTITVEKRLRGDVPLGTTFTVAVTCDVAPGDLAVPAPPAQTYVFSAAGGTHQFQVSNDVRDCRITETIDGGATSVDYQAVVSAPNQLLNAGPGDVGLRFAPGGGQVAQVAITNRFPGDPRNVLTINKVITGNAPEGELTLVEVACSNLAAPQFLVFGHNQPPTQEVSVPAVPGAGACTVRETVQGTADQVVYAASSDGPNTVLLIQQPPPGTGSVTVGWPVAVNPAGDEAEITITNRYPESPLGEDNTLRVKKRFRNDVPGDPSVEVQVSCSGSGAVHQELLTITDQTPIDLAIPSNRPTCVVRELDDGGAVSVDYLAVSETADATDGPSSGRIEFGTEGGERGKVRITNTYPGTCPTTPPKYC